MKKQGLGRNSLKLGGKSGDAKSARAAKSFAKSTNFTLEPGSFLVYASRPGRVTPPKSKGMTVAELSLDDIITVHELEPVSQTAADVRLIQIQEWWPQVPEATQDAIYMLVASAAGHPVTARIAVLGKCDVKP